jgi:hypothetical protein
MYCTVRARARASGSVRLGTARGGNWAHRRPRKNYMQEGLQGPVTGVSGHNQIHNRGYTARSTDLAFGVLNHWRRILRAGPAFH